MPSFSVLEKLISRKVQLDDLTSREFEILIPQLLIADGYEVELMQGSKHGGVDVVAVKDLGPGGFFKAVWQGLFAFPKNPDKAPRRATQRPVSPGIRRCLILLHV